MVSGINPYHPTMNVGGSSTLNSQGQIAAVGAGGGFDISQLLPLLAAGGMGPAALLGLAPALLGKLGLFGEDPQQKLRKQLMDLINSQGQRTQQAYQQNLASPAYSTAQGTIAAGANQAGNQLSQSLAARGIGTSGVGAILPAVQGSMAGPQLGQLRTNAYGAAQQTAQDQIAQLMKVLQGTSGPSQNTQLLGAGINRIGQFGGNWLANKYPSFAPQPVAN